MAHVFREHLFDVGRSPWRSGDRLAREEPVSDSCHLLWALTDHSTLGTVASKNYCLQYTVLIWYLHQEQAQLSFPSLVTRRSVRRPSSGLEHYQENTLASVCRQQARQKATTGKSEYCRAKDVSSKAKGNEDERTMFT